MQPTCIILSWQSFLIAKGGCYRTAAEKDAPRPIGDDDVSKV
jgi:hypothetical protein